MKSILSLIALSFLLTGCNDDLRRDDREAVRIEYNEVNKYLQIIETGRIRGVWYSIIEYTNGVQVLLTTHASVIINK